MFSVGSFMKRHFLNHIVDYACNAFFSDCKLYWNQRFVSTVLQQFNSVTFITLFWCFDAKTLYFVKQF